MADDFSELLELAADLSDVPSEANRNIRKAIEVTARNVKDDWRQGADRSGLGGYAADIDYDMRYRGGAIEAEIGPTPGDSGSFGFVEEATGDVRSAPQHAGRDAVRANEDDLIRGLELAALDAIEKR